MITYPLQTLKDNVKLLTPEVLDKINVHFPTDISLLFDAIRKMIRLAAVITQGPGDEHMETVCI
jgi:hypothetical protein